jgi:hypothetical protein
MDFGESFMRGMEMGQRRKLAMLELEQRKQEYSAMQEIRLAEANIRAQEFAQQQADRAKFENAAKSLQQAAAFRAETNRTNYMKDTFGSLGEQMAKLQPKPKATLIDYETELPGATLMLPGPDAFTGLQKLTTNNREQKRLDASNALEARWAEIENARARNQTMGTSADASTRRGLVKAIEGTDQTLVYDPKWKTLKARFLANQIDEEELNQEFADMQAGPPDPEKKPTIWGRIWGGESKQPSPSKTTPVTPVSTGATYRYQNGHFLNLR